MRGVVVLASSRIRILLEIGSRAAVDEKQIEVDGEKKWLYAAIDTDSRLILDVAVFSRRGTDSAAAFLHRLTEKHDAPDSEFLTDAVGRYLL